MSPPDSLTTWFLSAKRSLSSITLCERAHLLVDTARAALQEASIVSSRCIFLGQALADQLTIAGKINQMMHSTQESFRAEFEKTLTDLDKADIRLNRTLDLLRNSVVDPAFLDIPAPGETEDPGTNANPAGGNSATTSSSGSATHRFRTLHDFVEDEGIEQLKTRLRHSIDYVQESHDALHTTLALVTESLGSLNASLTSVPPPTPLPPLQQPLHSLEEHTAAMANLLESLTNHYDRCSDALKSAESGHPLDPDLYDILSRDAGEVPDVVRELKERLQEMEEVAGSGITASIRELNVTQHQLLALFHAFEEFSTELAACMVSLREFESRQEELKTTMSERLEELWGLGDFYEGFFGAYDAMVVEVGRRRGVQKRMELVVRDAVEKLRALHEEDLNDREQFRDDWGQWLPVDIWPGIGDPPVKYQVEKDLQGGRELPELAREVVEKAYVRRKEKGIVG